MYHPLGGSSGECPVHPGSSQVDLGDKNIQFRRVRYSNCMKFKGGRSGGKCREHTEFPGERNETSAPATANGPEGVRGVTCRQCSWSSRVIWSDPAFCESQEVKGLHLCVGSDEVCFLDGID